MAGKGKETHHRDLDDKVYCCVRNVTSVEAGEHLTKNIQALGIAKGFDQTGLASCAQRGDGNNRMVFTRREANGIRDKLDLILADAYTSVWFSTETDPFHSLFAHTLADTEEPNSPTAQYQASCHFGSLRSYDRFYSHVSFNNKVLQISIQRQSKRPDSLSIRVNQLQKIIVPIASIQKKNILVNKVNDKEGVFILFPLKYTPRIIQTEPSTIPNQQGKDRRVCDQEGCPEMFQDISKCSDLVLHFSGSDTSQWMLLQELMSGPGLYTINFGLFKVRDWSNEKNRHRPPDPFKYQTASFKDRYVLQMLTSLGYVFRDKWAALTDKELGWHEWNPSDRYDLCCYAVERLREDHAYDLTRTADDYKRTKTKREKEAQNQLASTVVIERAKRLEVATCTLTPMRVIFRPLDVTSGSRALRNPAFGGPKNFLLVHFREENNEDLRASKSHIQEFLRKKMLDGIVSLGRTYKFMGASTGQLKEMAFWFVDLPANFASMTDAHLQLGKFGEIKNIATYVARVGQYFSSTWPIGIQLTKVKDKSEFRRNTNQIYVTTIPDEERNGRCFTDGIGKISWGLAGRVAQRMGIQLFRKEDIPSAFQIRVAGCKGMVAIDPESTLDDYYIQVRESMEKFTSDDWNLEICEVARPLTLTFNNQVIRLLRDLGNPDSVFRTFQNLGLNSWRVPEEQQSSILDIGLQKTISYAQTKRNLLKNRIPVPPQEGRNLFGVVDETRTLEYGECFIQYSSLENTNDGEKKYHVITGPVVVTKNPCMWPGDFRRLTAVANKQLKECMRDVIVFPMKGERPHPNEISGSDLDGDQYWVYWGDRLTIKEQAEPLAYGSAEKAKVSAIDQTMIVEHIVKTFGAGGVVGMIANTHTVAADRCSKENHSFAPDCKKLAELFSIAIDAPKTGKTVDKEELRPYQRKYCSKWPQFMMKLDEPTYESQSILEKLFLYGKEQYFKFNETPQADVYSPNVPPKKGQPGKVVKDESFQRWLERNPFEEVGKVKKPEGDRPPTATAIGRDSPQPETPEGAKVPVARKKTAPAAKKTADKVVEPTVEVKTDPPAKTSTVLINTDGSASGGPSLSSFLPSDGQPCQADLILAVNGKTSVQTNIQYSHIDPSFDTFNLKSDKAEAPNVGAIIDKLVSYIDKQHMFKPKSTKYNVNQHGPLSLVVLYGRIGVNVQKALPEKLGELQKLIGEQHDQLIRFFDATAAELSLKLRDASAVNKNATDYELECRLSATSNETFTLQFNSAKTLQRICVFCVWAKCFVRQPNFRADSVYEIRSVRTYEVKSPEFTDIVKELFNSEKDTKILGGRKPNIQISRNLLRQSVIVMRLKVIEKDQPVDIAQSDNEVIYREVIYPSIQESAEKGKLPSRLEYHAPLPNKDPDYLRQVCRHALSPTEN